MIYMKHLKNIALVFIASVLFAACGNQSDKKNISFAYANWAEGIAITNLAKVIFEEEGYTILEMEDFMDKEKKELNYSNKKSIDHTGDIFKLLGLSPDEVFRIDDFFNTDYKITQDLNVYLYAGRECWLKSEYTIADFLNGTLKIYKKPVPTEKAQLAIDYAKTCGCKSLTENRSGKISAFDTKPFKIGSMWVCKGEGYTAGLQIGIPISFINWDDEEPYYIGD